MFFFTRVCTIYICAALGGFIAALADIVQKEEASAVSKLTSLTARHLGLLMAPYWVLIVLVILAVALCFVFQPSDRKQSFVVGMGIIAAVMTVTPYKQPPTGAPLPPAQTPVSSAAGSPKILWLVGQGIPNDRTWAENPDVFTVEIRNSAHAVVEVGLSVFNPVQGQDYYQKSAVQMGQAASLNFDLQNLPEGETLYYSFDIDGVRLPPQPFIKGFRGVAVSALVTDTGVSMASHANAQVTRYPRHSLPGSVGPQGILEESNSIIRKLQMPFGW